MTVILFEIKTFSSFSPKIYTMWFLAYKMKVTNQLYDFISMRYAFFSEVGIGISANTILLLFRIFTFLLQHRLKPTDLIICLLALIHIGMLIIMGYTATNIYVAQDLGMTSNANHLSTFTGFWGASPFVPPACWVSSRSSPSAPKAPACQSSNINPHVTPVFPSFPVCHLLTL